MEGDMFEKQVLLRDRDVVRMRLAQPRRRHADELRVALHGRDVGRSAVAHRLLQATDQLMAPLDPEMVGPIHDRLREHGIDLVLGAGMSPSSGSTNDRNLYAYCF